MRLKFVFVGKTAFSDLDKSIRRYVDRLGRYAGVEVHYVKAEKVRKKIPEEETRRKEGERILNLVGKKGRMVIWDERGKQLSSVSFARFLDELGTRGDSQVWMIVGGALGVSSELKERADDILSLSSMTLPHDLARLVLVEQVYRAFTIIKGEPYHK